MGLRVTFDLGEEDLRHFQLIMREARKAAAQLPPEAIVSSAETLLGKLDKEAMPGFVAERLQKLGLMIRMLRDDQWRLPGRESTRVLNALAYFAEPEDLIPDHIPGVGLLDDAIMIELLVRELKHEIEAYADFCDYRSTQAPKPGIKPKASDLTRDRWLDERREALQSRMRRRREGKRDGARRPLGLL